jgi:multidrug resistance efflux pump
MMLTSNCVLVVLTSLVVPAARPTAALPSTDPTLENCRVALIEKAQVPGREAGVLLEMNVHEGMQVKKGEALGLIDDAKAEALKRVKEKEFETSVEQASSTVNVRYAEKAARVAEKEFQKAVKANESANKAVAEIEVEKLRLAAQKAVLQIEQAQLEMKVAKLTSEVKSAEVEAAETDIKLRRINSPLDGEVVHVYKHVGEWIPPGDPVVQIVRVDRLRIEGFVNAAEYSPSEIGNRPVVVEAELARGRKVQFNGKIVYVSPLDQPGGEYLVWAEVENRQENGNWLLRAGTTASMTIQLK